MRTHLTAVGPEVTQRSNDWALAWTRAWFKHFRSLSLFNLTKFPRSTSATRAISVLSSIILPLQTFFFRVLLLRQQPFWSENLPPERPTTTIAIKTQVFMFRSELVNSARKFTIVAEIFSLLKKIYKRDAPFKAVFKVKTLAVLFSPYPREMKHIPRSLNLPPFWRLLVSLEMVQFIPTRALSRARGLSMRTHLTALGPEVAILGADQKELGLWGRECLKWYYDKKIISFFPSDFESVFA